jgi:hypothetical protein
MTVWLDKSEFSADSEPFYMLIDDLRTELRAFN